MKKEGTVYGNIVLVAFLSFGAFAVMVASSKAKEDKVVRQVHVSDIPDRVQLIGRLGHPLGDLMSVSGKWYLPEGTANSVPKEVILRFRVFKVNGKQLDVPIEFDHGLVSPVDSKPTKAQQGDIWNLRAVETGGMRDLPAKVWRERWGLSDDGDSPVAQIYGFSFVSELVYLPPEKDDRGKVDDE